MSLKFLSKKSWHTTNLDNVEKVWIAEQAAEKEKKKLAELQKQINEERQIQELRQLQITSGQIVKNVDISLDWMYEGPTGSSSLNEQSTEEYLLGKIYKPKDSSSNEIKDLGQQPGSLWLNKISQRNDTFTRLHEDPLLLIKKNEKEARENVVNNPVKMARIRHQLTADIEKEKEKKQQKKEKKRAEKEKEKELKGKKHSQKRESRSRSVSHDRHDNDRRRSHSRDKKRRRNSSKSHSRSRSPIDSHRRPDRNEGRYAHDHHKNNGRNSPHHEDRKKRRESERSHSRDRDYDRSRNRDRERERHENNSSNHNHSHSHSRSRSPKRREVPERSNHKEEGKTRKEANDRPDERSNQSLKGRYGLIRTGNSSIDEENERRRRSTGDLGPKQELLEKKKQEEANQERERKSKLQQSRTSGYTKALTAEEKEERLKAMMCDADLNDELRLHRHRPGSKTSGSAALTTGDGTGATTTVSSTEQKEVDDGEGPTATGIAKGTFLQSLRSEIYTSETSSTNKMEDRMRRNRHYYQKGADLESDGFMKKN